MSNGRIDVRKPYRDLDRRKEWQKLLEERLVKNGASAALNTVDYLDESSLFYVLEKDEILKAQQVMQEFIAEFQKHLPEKP